MVNTLRILSVVFFLLALTMIILSIIFYVDLKKNMKIKNHKKVEPIKESVNEYKEFKKIVLLDEMEA